jgi:SAM-dependent methyltransferase
MTTSRHDENVRRSFRLQADEFAGPDSVYASDEGTNSWIAPLDREMIALDVACGAAHAAEAAAPFVRQVVGVDITAELLDLGADRLRASGVNNVLLQEANAHTLPFLDSSFDLVFCRASLHHFAEPRRAIHEMVRVCRPGGRIALNELVAPSVEVHDQFDQIHRFLDPSHMRTFTQAELLDVVRPLTALTSHQLETVRLPLTIAVSKASADAAATAALTDEMSGGCATGFEPVDDDGTLFVSFPMLSLQAER